MQHRNLWWIPQQNWAAERDYFADGSRGQRIYVNPRLHTIIVQLADESARESSRVQLFPGFDARAG
jgi:hypothetical protein